MPNTYEPIKVHYDEHSSAESQMKAVKDTIDHVGHGPGVDYDPEPEKPHDAESAKKYQEWQKRQQEKNEKSEQTHSYENDSPDDYRSRYAEDNRGEKAPETPHDAASAKAYAEWQKQQSSASKNTMDAISGSAAGGKNVADSVSGGSRNSDEISADDRNINEISAAGGKNIQKGEARVFEKGERGEKIGIGLTDQQFQDMISSESINHPEFFEPDDVGERPTTMEMTPEMLHPELFTPDHPEFVEGPPDPDKIKPIPAFDPDAFMDKIINKETTEYMKNNRIPDVAYNDVHRIFDEAEPRFTSARLDLAQEIAMDECVLPVGEDGIVKDIYGNTVIDVKGGAKNNFMKAVDAYAAECDSFEDFEKNLDPALYDDYLESKGVDIPSIPDTAAKEIWMKEQIRQSYEDIQESKVAGKESEKESQQVTVNNDHEVDHNEITNSHDVVESVHQESFDDVVEADPEPEKPHDAASAKAYAEWQQRQNEKESSDNGKNAFESAVHDMEDHRISGMTAGSTVEPEKNEPEIEATSVSHDGPEI